MKKKERYNIFELTVLLFKCIGIFLLIFLIWVPALWIVRYLFRDLHLFGMKYTSIPWHLGNVFGAKFEEFQFDFPMSLIVTLFEVAIGLLILAIFYAVIPLFFIGFAKEISSRCIFATIDSFNDLRYAAEARPGRPHKERLSGKETIEAIIQRYKDYKDKKDDKKFQKWLRQHPGIIKGYYTGQMEGPSSANDIVDKMETEKLKAAREFYGFKNFDFTEDELNKQHKKMVLKYHPDTNSGPDAEEKSQQNGEYSTLLKSFKHWK